MRWLTVEGFTAVGLPIVSILMLLVGLHENADIQCARKEAFDLFGTLLVMQPRAASEAGRALEEAVNIHKMY